MLTFKEKTITRPDQIDIQVNYEGQDFLIKTSEMNEKLNGTLTNSVVLLDVQRLDLDRITYSPQMNNRVTDPDQLVGMVKEMCDNYNKEVDLINESASRAHKITSKEIQEKGLV